MYRDSAYFNDKYLVTGGPRGMDSVREIIEWSYRDLKTNWKVCNWKVCLKLRQQPVAKIIFVCMLLRNISCTIQQSQVSDHFRCAAPYFDDWISQGPKGRPLPI